MIIRFALAALAIGGGMSSAAELTLPSILGDHALLQAGKKIAVWGRANPGAQVTVEFLDGNGSARGRFAAVVDARGKWSGELPALPSGTAGSLKIVTDKGETKVVADVLTGEVWLAAGQSNMLYNTAGKPYAPINADEAAKVAENCRIAEEEAREMNPPIRVFQVEGGSAGQPLDDVKGHWAIATPDNVTLVSAIAWNFGVALEKSLHQPVGLVVSAVGGTPVQAWMSQDAINATQAGRSMMARYRQAVAGFSPALWAKNQAEWQAFWKAYPTPELQEKNKASRPRVIFSPDQGGNPARLYNAMIHGLEPYTIRGVIWDQASGNEAFPYEYAELVQAMIRSWRAAWHDEFPFFYVELNNYRDDLQKDPVQPNGLSILREQQQAALKLPKVDVVAAIDLGTKNGHYTQKKPTGERLAKLALHEVYGQPGLVDSPAFKSFKIEGNKVRVTFDNADGLRVRGGGAIKGFAIRGEKGPWVWADGEIDGADIILSSAQVPQPAAVRYAWAMFPVISIENSAGLPLRPFRTDTDSPQ